MYVVGGLAPRVKSSPTSYPLTVSSQVIQEPHGMRPPEQFICVPDRLANEYCTSPSWVTCTVDVPPRAEVSYVGVPGAPNEPPRADPVSSWLRPRAARFRR